MGMETDTCMLDGDWWLSPFLVLFLATLYSLHVLSAT
jgi:hypothetical protein